MEGREEELKACKDVQPQSNDSKELDSASKLSEHRNVVYRTLREHRCWHLCRPSRIKIYEIVHNAVKAIKLFDNFSFLIGIENTKKKGQLSCAFRVDTEASEVTG